MNSPWEDLVMTVNRQNAEISKLREDVRMLTQILVDAGFSIPKSKESESIRVSGVPYSINRGDIKG